MSDSQEFEPLEDSADDILARMRQLFCTAMHDDFSEDGKKALLHEYDFKVAELRKKLSLKGATPNA